MLKDTRMGTSPGLVVRDQWIKQLDSQDRSGCHRYFGHDNKLHHMNSHMYTPPVYLLCNTDSIMSLFNLALSAKIALSLVGGAKRH